MSSLSTPLSPLPTTTILPNDDPPVFEDLRLELGAVSSLIIQRPKALNALNGRVLQQIENALLLLEKQQSLRLLLIRGSGEKAFVAGADIAEMQAMSASEAQRFSALGHRVMDRLSRFSWPTVAVVQGYALGGGFELALACDFIWASSKASFALPEITLGLIPGFGGVSRLTSRIGPTAARHWLFHGQSIAAEEALRLGIVQRLWPSKQFLDEVEAAAAVLAKRAPLALKAAKQASLVAASSFEAGLMSESAQFSGLFYSADTKEGLQAFLEKRPANFQGQ